MSDTDFKIIIDTHESDVMDALDSDFLKKECGHLFYESQTLDVGDFLYTYKDQPYCLIERKTISDYVSSITDGRLKNQSLRISQLKKDNPELIVVYLIEGGGVQKDHIFKGGVTRSALYTSLVNKVVRDQYIVYPSANVNDTALIVTKFYDNILKHINENKLSLPVNERLDYLKTIKVAKKENMTPDNCYLCQLSQIPGLSVEIANVIAQSFPTMRKLILAYESLTLVSDKENLVAELNLPIANQKTRRIGNVLSKRVYEYLCPVEKCAPLPKLKIKLKSPN